MKLTDAQRTAASYYWAQILNREVSPAPLVASQKRLPSFMATMEAMNRNQSLEKLEAKDANWSLAFMNSLDSLLHNAEIDINLVLEHGPQGLLQQAAAKAGIPDALFPLGKLNMTFDDKGNLNVGGELIDADAYVKSVAKPYNDDSTPNWCLVL